MIHNRGEVHNGEEFLSGVDHQNPGLHCGVSTTPLIGGLEQQGFGLICSACWERGDLAVAGPEQRELFPRRRAHVCDSMRGVPVAANFFLLLLASGSQLYEVPRPLQLLVLCFEFRQDKKRTAFPPRRVRC